MNLTSVSTISSTCSKNEKSLPFHGLPISGDLSEIASILVFSRLATSPIISVLKDSCGVGMKTSKIN